MRRLSMLLVEAYRIRAQQLFQRFGEDSALTGLHHHSNGKISTRPNRPTTLCSMDDMSEAFNSRQFRV